MKTNRCDGCLNLYPADDMTPYQEGILCPRCVFVLGLYAHFGIKKGFDRGGLAVTKINRKFREIMRNEFDKDPRAAFLKYLGKEIREEEFSRGIFEVCEQEFSKLKEGWPFVLLTDEQAENFKPEIGKPVEAYHGKERIQRIVTAVKHFAEGEALRYRRGSFTALFVPEVENAV